LIYGNVSLTKFLIVFFSVLLSKEPTEYAKKKLKEIEQNVNVSLVKLMKEEWTLKSPILRQPIILLDIISQKAKCDAQRSHPSPQAVQKSFSKHRIKLPALCLSAPTTPKTTIRENSNSDISFNPEISSIKGVSDNDRKVLLNNEITIEFISHTMQKLVKHKKSKLEAISSENTILLNRIQKVDNVFFLEFIIRRKYE